MHIIKPNQDYRDGPLQTDANASPEALRADAVRHYDALLLGLFICLE